MTNRKALVALSTLALLGAAAAAAACAPAASSSSPDGGSSSGNPPPDATDGGVGDGATGTDGSGGGGSGPATSCSKATLFAGDPVYNGDPSDRPAPGTGIKADPPLQWENLVFVGKNLFTRDTGELWVVDTSAANPVENRVLGKNDPSAFAYAPGACATARLGKIEGIATLADGSLIVTDSLANAVLHVKDPLGAGCTVEVLAGNATPNPDMDPISPPGAGDQDGPGASAKLSTPGPIVTDDAGNAYFFDRGNKKFKKVANDAAHTVSTLAKLPADGGPDNVYNITRIGSTLYAAASSFTDGYIVSLPTAGGALTTIISGRGDKFPPLDSAKSPDLGGITTDGTGLIVSGAGYVWYVTTDGKVSTLAGNGNPIDFPVDGYDPKADQTAQSVYLPPEGNASSIGSSDYITYEKGALYFRGHKSGTAAFVERISCP